MDNNVNIPQGNDRDFGLIDFMDEENFEQFIELIRGENEEPIATAMFCHNYDFDHISGCLADDGGSQGLFDYNNVANMLSSSTNVSGHVNNLLPTGDNDTCEVSSETTPPPKKSAKADRSKTLVCERKRRGRMKEMLYTLRSLVPNITKMDKASIIADAVLYVQDLQMQAKKLKAEIASLESSTARTDKYEGGAFPGVKKTNFTNQLPIIKKIFKIDVFQVEESGFYVRIMSNKGQQVAASLYKAVDSFASLFISSSNLATTAHNYVFTFTFKVRERESDINLPNLKLWIASAFLNQGFGFEASLS